MFSSSFVVYAKDFIFFYVANFAKVNAMMPVNAMYFLIPSLCFQATHF